MMSIHCLAYLILVVASCSQYKQAVSATTQFEDHGHGYFRNFPCPNAEDIQPCVCTYYEHEGVMDMDCTDIADEQVLYDIFNSNIPIPNFRRLDLVTKHLSTLADTVFGDVTFEDVRATGGTLTSVGPNTFMKSASTLRNLYLYYNELLDFPFETLSHYTQLESFSLSSNPISSFPIISSESLRNLYLYNTSAHTIPASALDGLPNLKIFYAYNTDIDSMATGLFTSLPQLETIYMFNTGFTHLESQQFAVSSTAINYIDLSPNQIATVDVDAFFGVQSGIINLKNNKLTILPETTWRPVIDAGVRLWLHGNDLTCGCDVAWLVLEPLYHSQVKDAVCHSGEKLVNLDPHDFESC